MRVRSVMVRCIVWLVVELDLLLAMGGITIGNMVVLWNRLVKPVVGVKKVVAPRVVRSNNDFF